MKSILVDALRQADGDDIDKTLSDSGSFEGGHEDFESPANDVLEQDDGDLELMSTTNALVVHGEANDEQGHEETTLREETPDDHVDLEFERVPIDDEHAVTVVGLMPLPISRRRVPRLASLAPLLCVVLAATVAGSWLLVNKVGMARAGLGALVSKSPNADSRGVTGVDSALENRFPFLEDGKSSQEGGSRQ